MNITIDDYDSELDYSIDFKYENDIISLVQRDKSSFNEELMVSYGTADTFLITYLLSVISNLNDVDYDLLDTDNFEKYGIVLDTEEVAYEYNDDNSSISMKTEYINDFSINLNDFEEAIMELKGTYNDSGNNNQGNGNVIGSEGTQDNDNIVINPKTGNIWIYFTLVCSTVSLICFGFTFKYRKIV